MCDSSAEDPDLVPACPHPLRCRPATGKGLVQRARLPAPHWAPVLLCASGKPAEEGSSWPLHPRRRPQGVSVSCAQPWPCGHVGSEPARVLFNPKLSKDASAGLRPLLSLWNSAVLEGWPSEPAAGGCGLVLSHNKRMSQSMGRQSRGQSPCQAGCGSGTWHSAARYPH